LAVLAAAAPSARNAATPRLVQAGMLLALLGFDDERASLAGSTYAQLGLGGLDAEAAQPPSIADRERAEMTLACRDEFVRRGLCSVAHPIGPGGLISAVADLCRAGADATTVGCALVLPAPRAIGTAGAPSVAAQLFHESGGRILLSIPAARYADATLLATSHGVPLLPLGRSGGRELVVRASDGGSGFREVLRISLAELSSPDSPSVQPLE
jgi:phosphoribosylformylglycinamidine synthase